MSDDLSIPRALREQNVMVPNLGPLSIYDLAVVGLSAVQQYSRADAEPPAKVEPAPPAEDGGDHDQLDNAIEIAAELENQLAETEAQEQLTSLDRKLETIDARGQALDERSQSIEAALEAGDVKALASLIDGYDDIRGEE